MGREMMEDAILDRMLKLSLGDKGTFFLSRDLNEINEWGTGVLSSKARVCLGVGVKEWLLWF